MDRRTNRTKKMIREGFLKELENKSIEGISVTELCQKIDLNHSTFYLHYTDIYDVL